MKMRMTTRRRKSWSRAGLIFLLNFLLSACGNEKEPCVLIHTPYGPILVELYPEKAPLTVQNFLKLVHQHVFDSAVFYRVVRLDNQPMNDVKIEVIQGGLYDDSLILLHQAIKHETTDKTGILHKDGVVSMARLKPGTASTEFFICVGDQPSLDYRGSRNADGQGFAAFGKVIQGMDVVRKIQLLPDEEQYLPRPFPFSVSILNE